MRNVLSLTLVFVLIAIMLLLASCSSDSGIVSWEDDEEAGDDKEMGLVFVDSDTTGFDYTVVTSEELFMIELNENGTIPAYAIHHNFEDGNYTYLEFNDEGMPDFIYEDGVIVLFRNIRADLVDISIISDGVFETFFDEEWDFYEALDFKSSKVTGKRGAEITGWSVGDYKNLVSFASVSFKSAGCIASLKATAWSFGALSPVAKTACTSIFVNLFKDQVVDYIDSPLVTAIDRLHGLSNLDPESILDILEISADSAEEIETIMTLVAEVLEDADLYLHPDIYIARVSDYEFSVFGGEEVSIRGYGLRKTGSQTDVIFGNLHAQSILHNYDDRVHAIVPANLPVGEARLHVNVDNLRSNSIKYEICEPLITSVSPQRSIRPGDIITINTEFFPVEERGFVSFTGKNDTRINVSAFEEWRNWSVKVKVPEGAVTGPIYFEAYNIKSNTYPIELQGPRISSVTPDEGDIGTQVTITGELFGEDQNNSFVHFGNVKATSYLSWEDEKIEVQVPENAVSGNLWVNVDGATSNTVRFVVPPVIEGIRPDSVQIYDMITITGRNFGDYGEHTFVLFNEVKATGFDSWSNTSIVAQVPPGATSGAVVVEINGTRSNGVSLEVLEEDDSETVTIGNLVWMQRNLEVDVGNNWWPWGRYCAAYDDERCIEIEEREHHEYGRLYDWESAKQACESIGWRLPTPNEWFQLRDELGGWGSSGGKLKSTRTVERNHSSYDNEDGHPFWYAPNTGATNESGFSALPAGRIDRHPDYNDGEPAGIIGFGRVAWFWSDDSWRDLRSAVVLSTDTEGFGYDGYPAYQGISVRCVKDE